MNNAPPNERRDGREAVARRADVAGRALRRELAVTASLVLLLPGMRFYWPENAWILFEAYAAAIVLWSARCIMTARGSLRLASRRRSFGVALPIVTFALLLIATLPFGVILLIFYRWLAIVLYVVEASCLVLAARNRPRAPAILAALIWIPLGGMLACWWNFEMIGAGPFSSRENPDSVRALLTVEQLKASDPSLGEAHPYALAYDDQADVLVASFKDDWGAIFPRADGRRHNFLAAVATRGEDRRLRTLPFGPTQIPENLCLRPSERRGWVDVLDMAHRTHHVAAFRYDDVALTMTAFADLPFEPNGIFDDPGRNRLLIVGIENELLELQPDTLAQGSRVSIQGFFNPQFKVREARESSRRHRPKRLDSATIAGPPGEKISGLDRIVMPLRTLVTAGMTLTASQYDARTETLFFGKVGFWLDSLRLRDFAVRSAPAFAVVFGLNLDEDGVLFAGLPFQRRVLALDGESLRTLASLDVGTPVRATAPMPGTTLVLAGGYSENRTVLVDRHTGKIAAEYRLGRLQRDAIADVAGRRVFVATGLGVFAIDGSRWATGSTGKTADGT